MEINKIRMKAQAYLQKHEEARVALKVERTVWKEKHGAGTDQMIVCNKQPRVKELIENEQMYGRIALMYATFVTMEVNWEAREVYFNTEAEKGDEREE